MLPHSNFPFKDIPERYGQYYNGVTSGVWVLDIETDGFWFEGTKIHCICAIDPVVGVHIGFRRVSTHDEDGNEKEVIIDEMQAAFDFFAKQKVIIAHNGIDFDIPFMKKINPTWQEPGVFDTMTLGSMVDSNRKTQSLASWGVTLCNNKMDYGKTADWSKYDDDMYIYCMQDVVVTADLYIVLCIGSVAANELYGIKCLQRLEGAGFDIANPPIFKS